MLGLLNHLTTDITPLPKSKSTSVARFFSDGAVGIEKKDAILRKWMLHKFLKMPFRM